MNLKATTLTYLAIVLIGDSLVAKITYCGITVASEMAQYSPVVYDQDAAVGLWSCLHGKMWII